MLSLSWKCIAFGSMAACRSRQHVTVKSSLKEPYPPKNQFGDIFQILPALIPAVQPTGSMQHM